ncbi:MarR family transcriptional regulator [Streptomyces clavifer]|uniref:MarR family winged helix-turn-helix transcriptional regulator n=1 Tax=Streptomyces clavifer TaxID=68188 RepID=UPI00332370E2
MADRDELDAQEQDAWLALAAMLSVVPAALEQQLQRHDRLSLVEFLALSMLADSAGHQVRMSDLAEAASSTPSRISRVVAGLESEGFVTRSMDPKDRRVVHVTLLPKGSAKLREAAPGHARMLRSRLFDRLTEAQLKGLVDVLQDITGAFGSTDGSPSL